MLVKDFENFIKLLHRCKVRYMIVGAYAVAFHGKPQHAKSLDIWVSIREENIDRLLKAIEGFGISASRFPKEDFLQPGHVFQIGIPPLSIVIFNTTDDVLFKKAFDNRQKIINGDLEVLYIGLDDLIQHKITPGHRQIVLDALSIKKELSKSTGDSNANTRSQ